MRIYKRKKPKTERQKLITDLDAIFSKFIRLRDSWDGIHARCITCNKPYEIKHMDCGHCISRKYLPTRWYEKNCAAQCKSCNLFNQGEQHEFMLKLVEKYGQGEVDKLLIKKYNTFKVSNFEFELLIKIYEKKYKELKEVFGI